MNQDSAIVAVVTAWTVVRVTGLVLAHRRAAAKAARDAEAKKETP